LHAEPLCVLVVVHAPLWGLQLDWLHCGSGDENSSALARVWPFESSPPVTRMAPEPVWTAVWSVRSVLEVIADHWPVAGLKRSAPEAPPPLKKKTPFGSEAPAPD
jgi:hypothetical protein